MSTERIKFAAWLDRSPIKPRPGYETGIMLSAWDAAYAEARKAALEEAVKLADERGARRAASAIRALIERESEEG